jgi:hypothetical protein
MRVSPFQDLSNAQIGRLAALFLIESNGFA